MVSVDIHAQKEAKPSTTNSGVTMATSSSRVGKSRRCMGPAMAMRPTAPGRANMETILVAFPVTLTALLWSA